jgi:hypothetical protein
VLNALLAQILTIPEFSNPRFLRGFFYGYSLFEKDTEFVARDTIINHGV